MMSSVTIIGTPISHYVQTVVLCCEQKGIAHTLAIKGHDTPARLRQPSHLRYHPFGKIPVLKHGERVVWETSAICRYLDSFFAGSRLIPTAPLAVVEMEQWISMVNSYLHTACISNVVSHYMFPRGADGKPDRPVIEAALPELQQRLQIVNEHVGSKAYLAGDCLSLADLFLLPLLMQIRATPHWRQLSADCRQLERYVCQHMTRATVQKGHQRLLENLPEHQCLF